MSVYFFGLIAAIFCGMTKTGVPGCGILGVLAMMLAFPGTEKLSSGAVLPLLVLGDVIAVCYYRRTADYRRIVFLLPSVFAGLILGTLFMRSIDDRQFKIFLAALVLVLIAFEQLRRRQNWTALPKSRLFAWVMGLLSGFTTLVGNAAGPVMSVYCSAQNLNKHDFMGTFAVFFFIVNVTKLPLVGGAVPGLNMITAQTLWFDLTVLPGLLAGAFIGRQLFKIVPERYFVPLILILNLLVPIQMIFF
ncbi:MAG: sulfite exporter TauE/SafE family protein [Planctomycetaceae bacterium]|jgi:uncharacterized membrane protein YfcA|nr:sulfite exporter TauE/SafE family protein [Planctomycetaceae bacterium]